MFSPVAIAVIAVLGLIVAIQGAFSVRAQRISKKKLLESEILGARAVVHTIAAAEREMRKQTHRAIIRTVDQIIDEVVATEKANGKSLAELLGGSIAAKRGEHADPLSVLLFGDTPFTSGGRVRDPFFTRGDGFTTTRPAARNEADALTEMLALLGGPGYGSIRRLGPFSFGIDVGFGDLDPSIRPDKPAEASAADDHSGSADPLADPVERTTAKATTDSDGGEGIGGAPAYDPETHHGSADSFSNAGRRVPRHAEG